MSLKIIHTADWHLGQTFFGYDRDEEHEAFLSWLIDILTLRQTDVLLIAGDVFDVANPSAAAQRRFFRFLRFRSARTSGTADAGVSHPATERASAILSA